jgi:hypothetical protein
MREVVGDAKNLTPNPFPSGKGNQSVLLTPRARDGNNLGETGSGSGGELVDQFDQGRVQGAALIGDFAQRNANDCAALLAD